MIIDIYNSEDLTDAFGIDMSAIELRGIESVGASWGRVAPGGRSDAHQHDEIEVLVIVAGTGDVLIDGTRHEVQPGNVVQFDPFETHVLHNASDTEVVFVTFYWRDAEHALQVTRRAGRRRFNERPVFVFSTPPTPNGDLHLGHLSGPYLGADTFVRFQRMNGVRAWHLTGSDDYQSYVISAARRDGSTPAEVAAHYSAEIAETLRLMDIEPDQYTVTNSHAGYRAGLQDFFSKLVKSGSVAPKKGPALFDAESGRYLYEVDVAGSCPTCSSGTGGNICEECGEPNLVVDLVEPRNRSSHGGVRTDTVTQFSLPLHEFRNTVARHHHLGRVPARIRRLAEQVFARETLDIPVSHPAEWGVSPREDDGDGDQVIWVWPEMSYGFLCGIEALGVRLGEAWQAAKPEQDWKIVHFFGYDNSFYHAILYPVLYKLAFPDWEPDIDYHVNEFYLLEGAKFSTSRRHAVWGREILSPRTVDAVRFYLSRTRPEGRRTNFERDAYQDTVKNVLLDTWQAWLNDLGRRVDEHFDGVAPDAGVWTPEHVAFLGRLGTRIAAVTANLNEDGFSMNQAAAELEGIVADSWRFAELEGVLGGSPGWRDEARTAIALELAAARLLSRVAAPVMPRFAARLAEALGDGPAEVWPTTVDLVPAGSRINLAGQEFFAAVPEQATPGPALLPWLEGLVRTTLALPEGEPLSDKTLVELGTSSLQTVTLQYKVLEELEVDISVSDLLAANRDIAALAALLASRRDAEAVTS